MSPRSIQGVDGVTILSLFLWPSPNPCVSMPRFLYPFSGETLRWFPSLELFRAATNTGMLLSLGQVDFVSLGHIPRIGTAGHKGSSVSSFLRKLHAVFHWLYFPRAVCPGSLLSPILTNACCLLSL